MIKPLSQLKYFAEIAPGELTANEQLVYFRLFMANNRLGWKEWFTYPIRTLCFDTGLTKNTVVKARAGLQEKGLIEFQTAKKITVATKYKIIPLNCDSVIEPIDEPIDEPIARPIDEPITRPDTRPIARPIDEPITRPDTRPIARPIARPITEPFNDYRLKTIDNRRETKDERLETIDEDTSCYSELREATEFWSDNVHIVTPFEAEMLSDFQKEYGKTFLLNALKETVRNNARSLKYTEAILKRWKSTGSMEPWNIKTNKENTSSGNSLVDEALALLRAKEREEENEYGADC